jgi:hypothetical protein
MKPKTDDLPAQIGKEQKETSKKITGTTIVAAIFASVYSLVILSFGAYNLVSIWPGNSTELASNTTVTLRGTPVSFSVGPETLLMLVMIIVGAVGACIFSLWAIAHHLGAKKDFDESWLAWYLLRPFIGAGLALIFYFLLRGGILTIGADLQNLNLVVVAGLSGLVGMFSEQALHKLHDLADTTFGPGPGDGNAEQLSITNVVFTSPATIDVVVQNAAGTDSSITYAFLNRVAIAAANITPTTPVTVAKSSQVTIKLDVSAITSGASYTIKLLTAKGTSVISTATYNQ